ncbi:hypothetical protein [Acetobacterium wieringae]|uniref:hypothetical protein n=1 Tax=Acetobacterium wieringae TaxID=52694 RepID=UPI0026EBEED4|nr:hypothetical protein [Acetobacterium wieringae]
MPLFGLGLCLFNGSVGLAALVLSLLVNGVVYYYFKKEIAKNLLTIHYFSAILRCVNQLLDFEKTAEITNILAARYANYHF